MSLRNVGFLKNYSCFFLSEEFLERSIVLFAEAVGCYCEPAKKRRLSQKLFLRSLDFFEDAGYLCAVLY